LGRYPLTAFKLKNTGVKLNCSQAENLARLLQNLGIGADNNNNNKDMPCWSSERANPLKIGDSLQVTKYQ
jgi:hypothetical protein